ncbi:MAG: 3-hydroxyacyl-CoA dehydrogenase/enoyl-CoA hydratase family protein [Fidelibacterota bacterium]
MAEIRTVGIVGAGTMGSALAQKFAQEGMKVIMVDTEDRFLKRGLERVKETLDEGTNRGLFSEKQAAEIVNRIEPTVDLRDTAGCQLVIEAVFEDFGVKKDLLARVGETVAGDAVVGTNTSSFSVSILAKSVPHPERFLGLHFFYHAAKNRLVEVVKGKATDDTVFRKTLWFMRRCGKDPIVCKDSPGFAVNRFFVPWLNEAARMVEEGLGETGLIDRVACETFGCSMGPFALMNATGVSIAYKASQTLGEAFGSFYRPAGILERQARAGDPWTIEVDRTGDSDRRKAIEDRLLGAVFFACGQLLEEKVCTVRDLNQGARIGLRWSRGPGELYQETGEPGVRDLVRRVTESHSRRVRVPESLSGDRWKQAFISQEKRDGTGVVFLNRPEDLNALNPTVVDQLSEAFMGLEGDDRVHTVVITGYGKAFAAGADLKFFVDRLRTQSIREIVTFTRKVQGLFNRIDRSDKTIIAAVNGFALGGGLELALTADMVLALGSARFAFPETGLGIYPGLGGTQRTARRIGPGLTKFLIFTGQMVSVREALEIGLIDGIIDWNELREIVEGKGKVKKKRAQRGDKWREVEAFFQDHSVSSLLTGEFPSQRWRPLVKRIRSRAPRALEIAERLIDEQGGPSSELEYLEEIFSTKDALRGLERAAGGSGQ